MNRTVTPHDNNLAKPVIDRLDSQLNSVVFAFGEGVFRNDMVIAQQFADLRPIGQPPPTTGDGVDDGKPFFGILHSIDDFRSVVEQVC